MSVKLEMRILKLTNEKHAGKCQVWITGQDGPSCFGMLYGIVSPESADLLQSALGIPCVRSDSEAATSDDYIEKTAESTSRMGALF